MMGYGGGWGMMGWFGGITMVLFWVALILLIVWLVRATFPASRRNDSDAALDLLRRRFAAGEISEVEYEQARCVLDRETAPQPGAGGR